MYLKNQDEFYSTEKPAGLQGNALRVGNRYVTALYQLSVLNRGCFFVQQ